MRNEVTFSREPACDAYEQLLTFAASRCATFLLVVTRGLDLSDEAKTLLLRLQPFELRRGHSRRWPGTELLDDEALVIEFLFKAEARTILMNAASRLFEWQQPSHPEDLCLLDSSGQPWLVTIAHERHAYLVISQEELETMKQEAPALHACLV